MFDGYTYILYTLLDCLNKANPLNVTLDMLVGSIPEVCGFLLRLNPPCSSKARMETARASFATGRWSGLGRPLTYLRIWEDPQILMAGWWCGTCCSLFQYIGNNNPN